MKDEKALVQVNGGAVTESEVVREALAFAKTGFGGAPVSLPKGYDISRAVKNLCFALPGVVNIQKATKDSIFQSVHDYITQGLDVGKKQCALIVYGDKLQVQRQYFGSVLAAKNCNPDVKDISNGTIVYEGETIELSYDERGRLNIKHEPDFSKWDGAKIKGAYAVVTYTDGTTEAELMTIEEIRAAWAKSRSSSGTVHKEFPVEMAKKTVLNRLCKKLINKTDDSSILDGGTAFDYIGEAIDVEDVLEYAEPEERRAEPELEPEEVSEAYDKDDPDYCISMPYKEYKEKYADCRTGNYNQRTHAIDVYPNRKKKQKREDAPAEGIECD